MDDRTTPDDRYRPLSESELSAASRENGESHTPQDEGVLVSPVPFDAPELPMVHPYHGAPTGRWAYRDPEGCILHWVFRFDPPGMRKQFSPLTLWRKNGRLFWHWKHVPAPRPLYVLDKLAAHPTAQVVVCEGEKATDAAAMIFAGSVATCSSNGSEAAKKADWSPLEGRRVLIWPDADEPGDGYVSDVAPILHEIGCNISIIDARALAAASPDGGNRDPEVGWDAADARDEWTDVEALRKKIEGYSKPFDPGPTHVSWSNFTMSASGLSTKVTKGTGKNAVTKDEWIASAFEIIGASRDPSGHGWGKCIRFRDADKRIHTQHVADSALQGEPSALCGMLADAGLRIDRAYQRLLVTYLSGVLVSGRVTHVDRTGWHDIGEHQVFVLPNHTISPDCAESVVLDASAAGPYETRGSLDDWQKGVGALAQGHALLVLGVSAAFAGPLLHLAGQEGGGVNIFGGSSNGKTTVLQTAASVWGRGDSSGYMRAWRTTANGLEGVAASATDTALILDELGIVEARDAAAGLYSLSNGVGKKAPSLSGG
jgi:putative DNA primase/helicase